MRRPPPTFVTLESGVRLHYRIQGESGKPWMVLLNGLLSDTTMWTGALPGLTADFRVLTFDSRGQGRSDAPLEGPYSTALLAEDAWELFEKLGVQNPWLVGLSNGSALSLELLHGHPGAFAGGVLTSSVPRVDFAMELKAEHWARCLETGGPLMQFEAVAPFLWGDGFLEARYGVLRAYHQAVTGGAKPMHGNLFQIRGTYQWEFTSRLPEIQARLLVLTGAEDLLTPPWKCLETAQGIPGARFEVVPGIGHAFPVEDPKGFAERVRRFVLVGQ